MKNKSAGLKKMGGPPARAVNAENAHPAATTRKGAPQGNYVGANVRGSKAKTFSRGK